jgi:hypothetical protein
MKTEQPRTPGSVGAMTEEKGSPMKKRLQHAAPKVTTTTYVIRQGTKEGAGDCLSRCDLSEGMQPEGYPTPLKFKRHAREAVRLDSRAAMRALVRSHGGRIVRVVSGYRRVESSLKRTLDATLRTIERQQKLIAKLKGAH